MRSVKEPFWLLWDLELVFTLQKNAADSLKYRIKNCRYQLSGSSRKIRSTNSLRLGVLEGQQLHEKATFLGLIPVKHLGFRRCGAVPVGHFGEDPRWVGRSLVMLAQIWGKSAKQCLYLQRTIDGVVFPPFQCTKNKALEQEFGICI